MRKIIDQLTKKLVKFEIILIISEEKNLNLYSI